jgi:hypothetical protein
LSISEFLDNWKRVWQRQTLDVRVTWRYVHSAPRTCYILITARAYKGRINRSSFELHCFFRCLVGGTFDCGTSKRMLPLPTRDVCKRFRAIDCYRTRSSTNSTIGIQPRRPRFCRQVVSSLFGHFWGQADLLV